ncbi:MAG: glutathione S-transferase family protein [Pseudomonadota bacterium]
MQLFYAATSPFVRKTMIVACECGLMDEIELVATTVAPGNSNRDFGDNHNPLRQIPTLKLSDGNHLYDSFVICDYLVERAGNKTMLPAEGALRTQVLRNHALLNGMTERAVATRYETFARPEEYRWPAMIEDNFDRIDKGLQWLNANIAHQLDGPFDISEAAFVALMKYLDLRFEDLGWRDKFPALVEPYEALCEIESVKAAYAIS